MTKHIEYKSLRDFSREYPEIASIGTLRNWIRAGTKTNADKWAVKYGRKILINVENFFKYMPNMLEK